MFRAVFVLLFLSFLYTYASLGKFLITVHSLVPVFFQEFIKEEMHFCSALLLFRGREGGVVGPSAQG